jgi:hypothetical protein
MKKFFLVLALISFAAPAQSEMISAYTMLKMDRDCSVLEVPGPDEPGDDWSRSLCNGWGGYPVFVDYGDARESLYFGFVEPGAVRLPFQSFGGFNAAGDKIEWRIEKTVTYERPIATILRWKVTVDPDTNAINDVLVVSKVGAQETPQACVIGYVLATGDADANIKARKIADEKAAAFTCGKDTPERIGKVPEPMGDVFSMPE